MRFGVSIAIILVILAASINGVAAYGWKNAKYVQGYFTDNVFNNGRIKFVINENDSKIFTADGKKS